MCVLLCCAVCVLDSSPKRAGPVAAESVVKHDVRWVIVYPHKVNTLYHTYQYTPDGVDANCTILHRELPLLTIPDFLFVKM